MEKIKFLLPLVLLALAARLSHAEEPLTWEQVQQLAAKKNPDLLSAQRSFEAKQAHLRGSFNGVFPRVSLNSSYNRSKFDVPSTRWQANGTASIDLFNQSRYADIQISGASLKAARASLSQTSATLLLNLRTAFADLLFAQEEVTVSEKIKSIRENNSRMVSLRYDSGRESKGNMLRAKAELFQAQADLAQAHRSLKAAQEELKNQTGEESLSLVIATGTLSTTVSVQETPDFLSIIDHQPDVTFQEAGLALAKANLHQSDSVLWPTLTASYTRSFQDSVYFPGNPNWFAEGVVSVPLFGGGPTAAYYSVREARRNLDSAEETLRSVRNKTKSDLESTWSALAGDLDQVQVQKNFLEAARQRNGEADIRYADGLLTYDNWELIVTDRVNFERSVVRSEHDAVVSEAQWDRVAGKELEGSK